MILAGIPIFKHDCEECTFLGTVNNRDLYVHPRDNRLEMIYRMSNAPDHYGCMIAFGGDYRFWRAHQTYGEILKRWEQHLDKERQQEVL